MGLLQPALRLDGGDEFVGPELFLQLGKDFRSDFTTAPVLRARLVPREKRVDATFAHGLDPFEEMAPCHPAQIGDLRGGVLASYGKLYGEETVLAPAIGLSGVQGVDDSRCFRTAEDQFLSGHA